MAGKIIAAVFAALGLGAFLLETSFLERNGEEELVKGAFGLIVGFAGAVGGVLGRRKAWISLLLAFVFAMGAAFGLALFFAVIWPML